MKKTGALGRFTSERARADYDAAYQRGLDALPAPDEVVDVGTGFGTVRCYRFGAPGPNPVLLLPGRAGGVVMWEPNLPAFAGSRPVYALDLLGEPGRSVQTAPVRTAADQAAWLVDVLERLDLRGAHLLGYSFGGWLAANLALRAPERLASLVLVDPVQTFARFPVQLLLRSALSVLPVVQRWGRPAFLRWIAGGAEVEPGDPVATVINEGIRTYRIALPTPVPFTDEQLRGLAVPALALIAGRSVLHDARRAAARAERFGVRAEVWETATHAIAGERADEVNTRVLAFWSEVEASRRG
ncbi:alpha/beta fold hydrolase [Actinokineospora bangkokensis]|uniref:alpha/beta fold hydrolase n=1 Tax=Actinokineospora bangkokensis TaxID=1193682 RepID=UPI000AB3640B|nr:alpha/beta hydrolase [Actinokineospora bangkokensis]